MDKTGRAYAAGWFTNASGKNYVAKYDGIVPVSVPDADVTGVKVYPNPAGDMIHVETQHPSGSHYLITDMAGRQVLQGALNTTNDIDVSMLPAGMYVLHTADNAWAYKFLKQ
jgi:hypothetical protein